MTENVSSSISSVQPRPIAAAARGRWLRRLMLAVIFLSGLMAGVGVTLLAVRQGVLYGIHHPEEMPERVAARLRRPLNLSDQQADRVEAIIQQRQTHLQEIRRRFQPEVEAELEQVYAEIRELLFFFNV